jgi:hypothetical protein
MPNRSEPPSTIMEEPDIDSILADSFPASDPPPWTLGVTHPPAKNGRPRNRTKV